MFCNFRGGQMPPLVAHLVRHVLLKKVMHDFLCFLLGNLSIEVFCNSVVLRTSFPQKMSRYLSDAFLMMVFYLIMERL